MTNESVRQLEWPFDDTVILTLDFECDYGTALPENTYQAVDQVATFVDMLKDYDVPLTTFVQTELLEKRPEAVEQLRNSGVDVRFHPHSHTHKPRTETSVPLEIEESTHRFERFFGHRPSGYRLPNGNVRSADYRHLAEAGYEFDASLFPSWRPNHFNNISAPTAPHYLPDQDLVEIPFTVYSGLFRIPTALSYCCVLGRGFTRLLSTSSLPVVVFNVHMHDFVNPPSFERLPMFYKMLYSRNADGFELFESVIKRFQNRGSEFATIDEAYDALAPE
jgi:peptidoglycan/xylan/chitin deacetylase (PgdA/CDA1 family)